MGTGGDQGLLNLYFSDWATKDIARHLPFVYNCVSTTFYSYQPAYKQYVFSVSHWEVVRDVSSVHTCMPLILRSLRKKSNVAYFHDCFA